MKLALGWRQLKPSKGEWNYFTRIECGGRKNRKERGSIIVRKAERKGSAVQQLGIQLLDGQEVSCTWRLQAGSSLVSRDSPDFSL